MLDLGTFIDTGNDGHSQRVSAISGRLAGYAGYSPKEVKLIEQAALYHDIGKRDVPPEILNKPGTLTAGEFEIVKAHTRLGYERITDAMRSLSAAVVVCKEHHERADGSGYLGLSGDSIHPYARLVAVADVFDALLSRRPYKEAWEKDKALDYFKCQPAAGFDARIVGALLAHADEILALYG